MEQQVVDLAVEQRWRVGVEDCGCHAASSQDVELGRRGRALGERLRADEAGRDRRAGDQQPGEDEERGLEAVVEGRATRRRDRVRVGVVRRSSVAAIALTAAMPIAPPIWRLVLTSPEAMPGVGALDTGEARDRDRDEREPEPGAAEHEGREQIPEVVAVHRQAGEQRDRDARKRAARRSGWHARRCG